MVDGVSPPLDPEAAERYRLVVSELVTNAVKHAGPPAVGQIRLKVRLGAETLRIEVADSGPGFRPTRLDRSPERESGRGLMIVDHLADRWGTDPAANRVWCELHVGAGADSRDCAYGAA